jgi:DNA-binding NtrC family response regulator
MAAGTSNESPIPRDEPTVVRGASEESPIESKQKDEPTVAGVAYSNESPGRSEHRDELTVAAGASDESPTEPEPTATPPLSAGAPVIPLKEALKGPEREIILQALQACGWSRNETAKALKINRTTLHDKMKKHDLLIRRYKRPRAGISMFPLRADRPG